MAEARSGRNPTWLIGSLCLLAGVVIGRLYAPGSDHVWSGSVTGGTTVPRTATQQAATSGDSSGTVPGPRAGRLPGFAEVVDKVAPGVVQVLARFPVRLESGDDPATSQSSSPSLGVRNGTGFLVNSEGLIVTSRHIVAQASEVTIWTKGHAPCRAELVGEDEVTDLAVLRLVDPLPGLSVLELGSSEELRAGDWIVTIGNPFGFARSVTVGVVSYVGRVLQHYDLHVTNDFLQFSAPVNPGSSGSPVLDLDGRVVGVTTQAMESAQGISFAIPSRTLKWVLDEMHHSHDGRVHRGYLGIEFQSRSEDATGSKADGAVITAISGEPAHEAGLRSGDVVLRVDGQRVVDAGELHERITHGRPGTKLALTVLRGRQVIDPIEVALRELGGPPPGMDRPH
jgi:S1-C subfamily serine protease